MSGDYDARVKAVEDATRLMLAMKRPPSPDRGSTFHSVTASFTPLDSFDVVELARFLLDIEDDQDVAAEQRLTPCRSGDTDCTVDCGWCKGTGYDYGQRAS